jgi:hypothetical protein
MQHIQAIPITINTVRITHMITHKNMHINNNATCKFITQLTLILVRMSPTSCRPSTNLPALDHIVHHSQQWVTPKLGLNSTQVRVPNQDNGSWKTRKTPSKVPTQTNILQYLIPHMPIPPKEVCPLSAQ